MDLGMNNLVALVAAASKGIEIAAAIAFLASKRAPYSTGVTLQVDGGSVRCLF